MKPSAALNARLDELTRKIDALAGDHAQAAKRQEAERRFQTAGELALPMSTEQVAIVLNLTENAINQWVHRRRLNRRFSNSHFGFHPDDVRAFLQSKRNPGRERINDLLQKKSPSLSEVLNGIAEDHT